MIEKLIKGMKDGGLLPPFFLVSKTKIDISEFEDIADSFIVPELPKDQVYLMGWEALPENIKNNMKLDSYEKID